MPAIRALDKLDDILASSENFLQRMHERGDDPHQHKQLNRLFSPSEAADDGRPGSYHACTRGSRIGLRIAAAESGQQSADRLQLRAGPEAFRAHFGTLPWRDAATDAPIVIACQNFKGGVGKSTTCVNFAHYLALKGYRVLVIDTDSQATTTSMFGYMPDAEITQEQTLLPYLGQHESSLAYAVRKTYWPNIDLIPACLALYEAEMAIAAHLSTQADRRAAGGVLLGAQVRHSDRGRALRHRAAWTRRRRLGMISINVLMAADALAGADGAADVRLHQHGAVLPDGAQLHRSDRSRRRSIAGSRC